ncbi:MAG: hypothetical protein ACP5U2_16235, partial [Bryobacteraceae bacterium]
DLSGASAARAYAAAALSRLPAPVRKLEDAEPYRVDYSAALLALAEQVRRNSGPAVASVAGFESTEVP